MMAAVHRYEGTVNQVTGDGIMALFGAPVAHEDHAAAPAMRALGMQEAIGRYSEDVRGAHGIEVQIRVGLNSGDVVVRAIGNDLHMDYSAIGQTTHLAARMEQLTTPWGIRLTAEAFRLVEGLSRSTAWARSRQGLTEPVEVFELAAAEHPRRLQAAAARADALPGPERNRRSPPRSPAPGRATARWWRWLGEAGWGSRGWPMSSSIARTQVWLVLERASVSYGKATPYFPVIDLLKGYFQIEDRDDAAHHPRQGHRAGADARSRPSGRSPRSCASRRPWRTTPPCSDDPPQRRQRTLEALKRAAARGQVQPCCWSLRTCTGSIPRPRPSSTAWSRASRRLGCCSWSTTARVSARLGKQDLLHPTRLDPLPPESAASAPGLWATTPGSRCSRRCSSTGPREPLLPGGECPDAGGDRGAGRGARRLPPDPAPAASRCRPRCGRCWPRVSTDSAWRRSGCSRRHRRSAPRSPSPSCRPLPKCPRGPTPRTCPPPGDGISLRDRLFPTSCIPSSTP